MINEFESYVYGINAGRKIIRNIIPNNVRQHNYFIAQGNYVGYMFRL